MTSMNLRSSNNKDFQELPDNFAEKEMAKDDEVEMDSGGMEDDTGPKDAMDKEVDRAEEANESMQMGMGDQNFGQDKSTHES
jgi:hypothetical protein